MRVILVLCLFGLGALFCGTAATMRVSVDTEGFGEIVNISLLDQRKLMFMIGGGLMFFSLICEVAMQAERRHRDMLDAMRRSMKDQQTARTPAAPAINDGEPDYDRFFPRRSVVAGAKAVAARVVTAALRIPSCCDAVLVRSIGGENTIVLWFVRAVACLAVVGGVAAAIAFAVR